MRWFRRPKESEIRLKKAEAARKQAQAGSSRTDDLVEKVVNATERLAREQKINRLAPAFIAAAVRRHR